MRVLSDDPLVKDWPKCVNCAGCKAVLEVELRDLDYASWKVSGYHFDGTAVSEYKYTFTCLRCGLDGNGNEFPESEIPFATRRNLQSGATQPY